MDKLTERINEFEIRMWHRQFKVWHRARKIERLKGRLDQIQLFEHLKKIGEFNNVVHSIY